MRIPISTDALSISLSYGMVSSSQVGMGQQNIMQMLRMADQALYHAKLMGRNRIEEWSQLLQEETNTIIEQD
jgi:PleD family two-component response regulator